MNWQQELNNVGKSYAENGGDASQMVTRKIDIQLDAIALGMPELIDDERTLRIFRKVSSKDFYQRSKKCYSKGSMCL